MIAGAAITGAMIAAAAVPAAAQTPATPQADSVTTRETSVKTPDGPFQWVRSDGHDYFLKATRPGSVLVEVRCRSPKGLDVTRSAGQLKVASRAQAFVDRLADGCAPKQGVAPESFTFEQRPDRRAKASFEATKPGPSARPPGAEHFPPDVDPHILPVPTGPNDAFPDETRY
jgi:hypothetical protein